MDEALLQRIMDNPRLPSLPAVAAQVIDLCQDKTSTIRELGEVLQHDPALSAKVLRTINSSYYGVRHRVGDIQHAVALLGLNTVKMLALGFSLVPAPKDGSGDTFDPSFFWRRCLFAAIGAHAIARQVKLENADETFIGALLQDLGVMVFLQSLQSQYVPLLNQTRKEHAGLQALEAKTFDLDHTQVGQALAEKWLLPEILIAQIRYHEDPDESPDEFKPLVQAVALSSKAADCVETGSERIASHDYFRLARRWFRLEKSDTDQLLDAAKKGTKELAKLFELDSPTPPGKTEEIMARANETLVNFSIETAHKADELEERFGQLTEQMQKDPLTEVAHRKCFDVFVQEQFDLARRQSKPLSLIFTDIDHFKSFNDTHGHQAGDTVLKSVAKMLVVVAPDSALVARYGGEEFVIVLPGADLVGATTIAERLRKQVESTPVSCDDGKMLSCTTSVGVASQEGAGPFASCAKLIKAADKAMYKAKSDGRNRVRVFRPKAEQEAAVA